MSKVEIGKLDIGDMEELGRLESSYKNDRYPRRYTVAADGEAERGEDKQTSSMWSLKGAY